VRYKITPIYPPAGIEANSIAGGEINNRGEVVGFYNYFLNPSNQWEGQLNRAFKFSHGSHAMELDLPEGWVTYAEGINNRGQIAISASSVYPAPAEFEAFRYTPGVGYETMGSFGGEQTEAEAINEAGQVTGFSERPDGLSYAFRYTDGIGMENIGTNFTRTSRGFAINDLGWVAGYGDGHAFVYRDDRGVINIGPGRAYGINNAGSVVGVSWVSPNDRAFIYKNGTLQVVGPEAVPYYLPTTTFSDINNYDVAVGTGVFTNKWEALIW
jgi:probable HAF family extracellular repeat protein